jgi:hypothetical protein
MKGIEEYKAMAVKPLLRKVSQPLGKTETQAPYSEEKAFTVNCINALKSDFEIKQDTPTPECDHVKAALYTYSALTMIASKPLDKEKLSDYNTYLIFSIRDRRTKNKQPNFTVTMQEETFGIF